MSLIASKLWIFFYKENSGTVRFFITQSLFTPYLMLFTLRYSQNFKMPFFHSYFKFLQSDNSTRSISTSKNFGKKVSKILGASLPQIFDIKEGAADAGVVLLTFFCHFITDLC